MLNSPRLLLFSLLRRVSSHSARWQDLKSGLLCDFLSDWQPCVSPPFFFFFLNILPFSLFCPQSRQTSSVQSGVSAPTWLVSGPSRRWRQEFLQTAVSGATSAKGTLIWQISVNFVETFDRMPRNGWFIVAETFECCKTGQSSRLAPSPCTARPFSASSARTKAAKWCRCLVKPLAVSLFSELGNPYWLTSARHQPCSLLWCFCSTWLLHWLTLGIKGLCKCIGWLPCGKAFLRSALKLISGQSLPEKREEENRFQSSSAKSAATSWGETQPLETSGVLPCPQSYCHYFSDFVIALLALPLGRLLSPTKPIDFQHYSPVFRPNRHFEPVSRFVFCLGFICTLKRCIFSLHYRLASSLVFHWMF